MSQTNPKSIEGIAMSTTRDHSDLDAWDTPFGRYIVSSEATYQTLSPNPVLKFSQSQAAHSLMPKNRRIQRNTNKGLFSWPRECRETLYHAVIHPYCNLPRTNSEHFNGKKRRNCRCTFNHKKATKLMVLCSQVWEEAIEVVHLAENVLYVAGQYQSIFRPPKDFGKPGFFQTRLHSTRLRIPQFLSEGQVLRMRRLAINISYPDHTDWQRSDVRVKNLKVEISAIVNAMRKSPDLEQVRIILDQLHSGRWVHQYQPDSFSDQHEPMRDLLRPLIEIARERGIKIGAEHYEYATALGHDGEEKPWTDPRVTWFNVAAILPKMRADFPTSFNQETEEIMEKNLGRCMNSAMPYELVPECRSCLQVFEDWEELATHLKKHPKHQMRFRYKKWNELYWSAMQHGPRKCPTCAKGYDGISKLNDHMEKAGHHRTTIVPRYMCNNNWYERLAKEAVRREEERERHELECKGCRKCGGLTRARDRGRGG